MGRKRVDVEEIVPHLGALIQARGGFRGTATELINLLQDFVPKDVLGKVWLQSPESMGYRLRRCADSGLFSIEFHRTGRALTVTISPGRGESFARCEGFPSGESFAPSTALVDGESSAPMCNAGRAGMQAHPDFGALEPSGRGADKAFTAVGFGSDGSAVLGRRRKALPTRQLSLFDLREPDPQEERLQCGEKQGEEDPFAFGNEVSTPAGSMTQSISSSASRSEKGCCRVGGMRTRRGRRSRRS